MSDGYDPCSLGEGKCIHHTSGLGNHASGGGGALHVKFEDDEMGKDGELWIPKSVIHDDSEVYDLGHEGEVIVESWWAEEKSLT